MDEAPVAANFDGVLSFAPTEVVDDVVDGDADDGAASLGGRGVEEAEVDIVAEADAAVAGALPDVSLDRLIALLPSAFTIAWSPSIPLPTATADMRG